MPKFFLDGNELEFKEGQTIIEAAKDHGVEIPHFCWHPSLSISGNCRMCLVEVEKMPKLVIACSTYLSNGMVVHSNSEKSIKARKSVMEFILINHPLDCPICDEAGECKLQEYTYAHSVGESRFIEEKQHKRKRDELGPRIVFDGERCISCSRCIRFSEEIAGKNQLTFAKRGDRVTIVTFPGESFDNPYTLNTVDICPVGALTSKDFRFKTRVWEMSATKSICIGCARGCNTDVWVRDNKILRLTPRQNDAVNSYWMCDNGRLNTFKFVNDNRCDGPKIKSGSDHISIDWNDAAAETVKRLKSFKPNEMAFLGSAFATCEDNYALVKLARTLGCANIDFARHVVPGDEDEILINADKSPNSIGAELVGVAPGKAGLGYKEILDAIKENKIKALYMLEDDICAADEDFIQSLSKLNLLILHASNESKLTALADIVFPAATFAEKHGTYINFNGVLQRIKPAVATAGLDRALDNLSQSRWDKFGTKFDRWAQGKKYDAKPGWKIISSLASKLDFKFRPTMAEDVFSEISAAVQVLKNITYEQIGDEGCKIELVKEKLTGQKA